MYFFYQTLTQLIVSFTLQTNCQQTCGVVVEGDGIGGTAHSEIYVGGEVRSMADCVALVANDQPNANGATWGVSIGDCWAELDQDCVNLIPFVNERFCLTPSSTVTSSIAPTNSPTSCLQTCGIAVEGDGTGGTDHYVGVALSMADCVVLVQSTEPTANGATWGTYDSYGGNCWAEFDQDCVNSNPYQNVHFGL